MVLTLQSAIAVLKQAATYTAIILVADSVGLGIDSFLLGRNMIHYFTLFTLGQAGLLFFVGGVMDVFSSVSFNRLMDRVSKTDRMWDVAKHRKAQATAAPLIVTGIFLVLFSFAFAYPLN